MFSIHLESIGPSNTVQRCTALESLATAASRIMRAARPSVHSSVSSSNRPYSSWHTTIPCEQAPFHSKQRTRRESQATRRDRRLRVQAGTRASMVMHFGFNTVTATCGPCVTLACSDRAEDKTFHTLDLPLASGPTTVTPKRTSSVCHATMCGKPHGERNVMIRHATGVRINTTSSSNSNSNSNSSNIQRLNTSKCPPHTTSGPGLR
jgi:hypothetical protein